MFGHEQFGSQGFQASRLVGQPPQSLKKVGFKMVWEGIEHQTLSSKANSSTPFGTILTVKKVQARDKRAHRSYQAPGIGKHDVFEGPGAETQQNI